MLAWALRMVVVFDRRGYIGLLVELVERIEAFAHIPLHTQRILGGHFGCMMGIDCKMPLGLAFGDMHRFGCIEGFALVVVLGMKGGMLLAHKDYKRFEQVVVLGDRRFDIVAHK